MLPIPNPEDYNVSITKGFLPLEPPLDRLPDGYYEPWEYVARNLQGLILTKRLRETVDRLEILSTVRLTSEAQWRRAYSVLAFITHAYIWGGDKPCERVPSPVTVPFMAACRHLELPPVATYAGLVLWNWKPIFDSEPSDTLANLDTINTFTGSLDEKWFYMISISFEARAGPIIPLMLRAIEAANAGNRAVVTECLHQFAERLDELGVLLVRMYEQCDPHVFYHRVRPFLAGSKNMAEAGLPHGVVFDDGGPINKQRYVQFSGGSNSQSSIIQFFDIVLGVQHGPVQTDKGPALPDKKGKVAKPGSNFIHDMRRYMPGLHSRFLEHVAKVANLRAFVRLHTHDRALTLAFDACVAMLSSLRDKHIQMVSRYIIVKSGEVKNKEGENAGKRINLANRTKPASRSGATERQGVTGTGGSSLIPFLRQARDETGEPAVEAWTRRLLNNKKGASVVDKQGEMLQGLAGVWKIENGGGLCLH